MSRRGRTGPVISLFAFQDIITSVTAIVMVITLLLAVDLIQRKQSRQADSSGEIARELADRASKLEAQLSAIKEQSAQTTDLVREIAATSPADLRSEISSREAQIAALQSDKERLQSRRQKVGELEKVAIASQLELVTIEEETAQIEQAALDLERQVLKERQENRIVFTMPRGSQKEGWIAVIESGRIIAVPVGREARPVEFRSSGTALFGANAAKLFGKWIQQQGLRTAYFLLLVRPGAAMTFDETEEELGELSVSHGFDVVSRDVAIIHPERGAAP